MVSEDFLMNYLSIFLFLVIAGGLSALMVISSLFVGKSRPNKAKNTAYECGFPAFSKARQRFNIRFYLVAILFIIFDIEVAFLFPWAITLGKTGLFGFLSMLSFLGILVVGFIYEWKKGALDWE